MYLARNVLDREIVDCNGFKAGKVDDLALELREGRRPIVRAIVTQQGALSRLFPAPLERLAAWIRTHILGLEPDAEPIRIGWEHVSHIDVVVHIDLDRADAGFLQSEEAIWKRWISHLPLAER